MTLDVRFKNQGLHLIEVQDNGSGISPANYPSVALKHHTSKLSSYADIASLQTFGFRGEALASLCALSNLTVTTCQVSEVPKGSKLSFEQSGKLKGTTMVAAQKGTTVSVDNIFHNLPVRRRELERNIKREWHKVISLLNQYACIQTNLKFSVSQQPTKGKRIHLFSTRGNPSTRENIINIFGAKTMFALVPLDLKLEMQPTMGNRGLQGGSNANSKDVHVVGHVSRPTHGEGRQTPDRQMFFVNGRPCGLPQFAKVFNEVYKSFNSSQSPFILADIQLDTDMYDVNVSPDKRSILLHDQNDLLDTLRDSLTALFNSHDYSLPTSQLLKQRQPEGASKSAPPVTSKTTSQPTVPDSPSESEEESEDEHATARIPPGRARRIGRSKSLAKEGSSQNLISRWVERKAQNRPKFPSPVRETAATRVKRPAARVQEANATNLEETSEASESEDDGKPRPVKDFNKRLAQFSTTSTRVAKTTAVPSLLSSDDELDHDEPEIPVVQIPKGSKADSPAKQKTPSAYKRVLPEPTAIVIGGQVIENASSPSDSRDREAESTETTETPITNTQPRPSFKGRLTQLFSATGNVNQAESAGGDTMSVDDEEDDAEEEGSREESDRNASRDEEEALPMLSRSSKADARLVKPSHASDVTTAINATNDPFATANEDFEVEASDGSAQGGTANVEESQPAPRPNSVVQRESLRPGVRRKDATFQTVQHIRINEDDLQTGLANWASCLSRPNYDTTNESGGVTDLGATDAEEKLSLTISKGDFGRMRVAGQFNMGFIIATRPAKARGEDDSGAAEDDELFIIDQHATDEKYNYERLQAITVVQSQRLVHPKRLELTALEEEIVIENTEAIEANGFKIHVDTSGNEPVGSRCQVLALPLSRETTFTLQDLEELISLLGDESSESKHIPRPSKVKKMFAMRACRGSIMIGKPLTHGQMETLVRHMGELDKPWNCPHGRPTMRHLCKLQSWDRKRWKGDAQEVSKISWRSFTQDG